MKKTISILLLLFMTHTIQAQNNPIDLEGIFTGKYRTDNLKNLSWRPQTTIYTYIENDSLKMTNAKTNRLTEVWTLKTFQNILNDSELSHIPAYQWIDYNTLYFPQKNIVAQLTSKPFSAILDTVELDNVIDQSIKDRLFITKDGNVFVHKTTNGNEPVLLCPDTGKHIVFGEPVHRSEWGINEGQYISPKGNYIAFYRMDESMVEEYPLVNTSTPIATVEPMSYPMAGRSGHQVTVGIFDVNRSMLAHNAVYHYIKTDMADGEYLTNITFSPDEKYLYITHLNRAQDHAKLIEYELSSGRKTQVLIEEHDNRYVEPSTRMYFLKDNRFIWQSSRDGWNHLYLYDGNGNFIRQLTQGKWQVSELIGTDEKEENIFFTTSYDQPVNQYVYMLNLKKGTLRNLTPEAGTHTPLFSDDKQFFIDQFTDLTTPRNLYLCDQKGARVLLLCSHNPYQDSDMGTVSIFPIQNKAGNTLYCRMIVPPDFDEKQSYPCLIYVYGGPHSQLVTNTFMSGGAYLYYLAQKGYVIFTLDNRGTSNRGAAFEKCIHRRLGVLEMEDQLCGVEYLKQQPFIDSTRIGLDGWSYGGFLIMSLITTYPTMFKSASCGGPVIDWRWYEVMYGERYMDTPQENPEGYAAAAILPKVKNIRCNLLVMHGAQDHTVVWQNTLQLLDQAVKDGIELDYFVYPSHDHNVRGIQRVHLWKKIEHFHDLNLK